MEKRFGKMVLCGVVFYNTTPHAIKVILPNGEELEIPRASEPLRLSESRKKVDRVGGIPINTVTYREEELPPPLPKVYYIVSSVVAARCHRADFLVVDETVRDEEGRIVGCKALARLA